jgi:WD40 repeat protein
VDISPDGRHVIWTTTGTVPRVWTIQDDSAATVFLGGEPHTLSRFAIDPRGVRLAATGTDGRVWLWRLADGKGLPALRAGHKHAVTAAFNHDGTLLLTADADGTARLWNVASRRPIAVMRNDGTPLTDARFSSDGKLIITADTAGRAAVWRTDTTRPVRTIRTKQGHLLGAAFSPDGRSIVTAHGKGARLWDAATGRPGVRLRGDERFRVAEDYEVPHPGVEFNRDGSRILMVGADGALRIWETSGRRLIETRGRHRAIVNHALFSPDGRSVAAGTDDGVVDIIDATTGKLAKRLSAGDSQVVHVGFSPDGKRLVGLGNDGISRVWDIASGDRLSVTRGREPFSFYWAAFTPDGKRVVTSNGDHAVRVEQCIRCLTVDELVALARQSAQRQLTARERHEYHLDEG